MMHIKQLLYIKLSPGYKSEINPSSFVLTYTILEWVYSKLNALSVEKQNVHQHTMTI